MTKKARRSLLGLRRAARRGEMGCLLLQQPRNAAEIKPLCTRDRSLLR